MPTPSGVFHKTDTSVIENN